MIWQWLNNFSKIANCKKSSKYDNINDWLLEIKFLKKALKTVALLPVCSVAMHYYFSKIKISLGQCPYFFLSKISRRYFNNSWQLNLVKNHSLIGFYNTLQLLLHPNQKGYIKPFQQFLARSSAKCRTLPRLTYQGFQWWWASYIVKCRED